jgi:hypothetical protein
MKQNTAIDLRKASSGFDIRGDFVGGIPFGTGHINDTFQLTFDQAGTPLHYTLQRLNTKIFRDPVGLMENVERVTSHAQASLKAAGAPNASRRALRLVPACQGGVLHIDDEGQAWRCYLFIETCSTCDIVDSPRKAFEAARAFARFQALLADMPGKRLNETIPDFHHTPKRYAAFHAALRDDVKGRAAEVQAEIDFALSQEAAAGRLIQLMRSGEIPERATHNDTKINNVLLDDATGEGICVIDLDTLMPGCSLYDFGDMVRSATLNMAEDSADYEQATCRREIFEALARGFLDAGDRFLNDAERAHMAFSGLLMTLECGVRFLTDHLRGDVYFKIHRPRHNLDRCRTQFALVRSILDQQTELQGYVDRRQRA